MPFSFLLVTTFLLLLELTHFLYSDHHNVSPLHLHFRSFFISLFLDTVTPHLVFWSQFFYNCVPLRPLPLSSLTIVYCPLCPPRCFRPMTPAPIHDTLLGGRGWYGGHFLPHIVDHDQWDIRANRLSCQLRRWNGWNDNKISLQIYGRQLSYLHGRPIRPFCWMALCDARRTTLFTSLPSSSSSLPQPTLWFIRSVVNNVVVTEEAQWT